MRHFGSQREGESERRVFWSIDVRPSRIAGLSPMDTVRAWLRGVEMAHYGDALLDAGYASMARVCTLKDADLLSVGVKRPEDRQIMLER